MRISTKTTLIIMGTLIIGFIIGVLGGGLLHQKRFDRIQRMDPGQRFTEVLDGIIKPDESQRQAITAVLKKQTQKIALLEEEYQSEIFVIFDSTRLEIKSLLSEEQIKQLENTMAKGQDHFISRRIERLNELLQLSKIQREQIEQIMRQSAPNIAPKKHPFLIEGRKDRANVRQMREELDKKIESVLTPEQIKIYVEFHRHRMRPIFKSIELPPNE